MVGTCDVAIPPIILAMQPILLEADVLDLLGDGSRRIEQALPMVADGVLQVPLVLGRLAAQVVDDHLELLQLDLDADQLLVYALESGIHAASQQAALPGAIKSRTAASGCRPGSSSAARA